MEYIAAWLAGVPWNDILAVVLRIFVILLAAWLVLGFARLTLNRLEQRMIRYAEHEGERAGEALKRVTTLSKLLRQGVLILVVALAILMVLQEVGVSIAPVLASAGIAGLAVGFGAQNLVRDVISGFFLILENQVRVDDVAIVNGTSGVVEEINFRTLVLRDLSGVAHIFPNGTIQTLSNMTKGWSAYVFDIGVAYKEDTDRVVALIEGVVAEMREDPQWSVAILDDVEVFGVDKFADSAVVIKGRVRTYPSKQWAVGREFLRRIKQRFDAEGVEIPFPHRSLYFGEGSKPFLTELRERTGGKADEGKGSVQEEGR